VLITDGVLVVNFSRVVRFPSAGRENVLVALVPTTEQHFSSVALLLLDGGVAYQPDVVPHVELEQRTALSSSLKIICFLLIHKA
jgi:hypothetical protein